LTRVGVTDYSILISIWQADGPCGPGATAGEPHFSVSDRWAMEDDSNPELLHARIGIIDFLVPFGRLKRTESALKRTLVHPLHSNQRVTIASPRSYASRQKEFLFTHILPQQRQQQEEQHQDDAQQLQSPESP